MSDLTEIVRCPICGAGLSSMGVALSCDCGYCLEYDEGIYKIKDNIKNKYFKFYNKTYFESSLYDRSSYRLNKILSLAKPREGRRILDLGCGPGEVAVLCAKRGAEVFGVDISRDALRLSAERSSQEGARLSLFEYDGEHVPFRDSTFDSIILSDVVEHVEDDILLNLLKECSRLSTPGGCLVIHTSPTRNIIYLSRFLKSLSMGGVDLYSKLIDPEYEFLHIRYHTQSSLRKLLELTSFHPLIWGEFRFLSDSRLARFLNRADMQDLFGDQLWCLAFKDTKPPERRGNRPYLGLIEPSSELDMGRCDELCINYGFYHAEHAELETFRWTGKEGSLFIQVPESYKQLDITLHTRDPDIFEKPLGVSLYLEGKLISKVSLQDHKMRTYSFPIEKEIKTGLAELRIVADRTFVPARHGRSEDSRELGVAVYKISIS